jgi:hypothetical protein
MRWARCLPALALSLCVVVAARAQDEKPLTSPYFPLQVGAVWNYRAGEATFQYKVARFEKVGKTNCARIELLVLNRVVSFEHVAVTKDGVQRFSFEGKALEKPITILPLELKEGAEWSIDSKVGGEALTGKFVLTKVGEKETVRAAGKDYQAVVVTGKDLKVNGTPVGLKYYFAEKVGMVKQELELAGNKVTFELEKYEPTPAKKEKEAGK